MPRTKVLILLILMSRILHGQDAASHFVYFPGTMPKPWSTALGLTLTTTPEAITEEEHISVPALDVHALRKAGSNFNLDAHADLQAVQNHLSLGFRWLHSFSERFSISAGDDAAGWVGWIKVETINTKGYGILNYPNLSAGYRFDDELLITLKAELLLNFYQWFSAGGQAIAVNPALYNGEAFTIALEQPFFKQTWLTLAFRAIYSNFFWETWALFENFDRNIFYPQLIAVFLL